MNILLIGGTGLLSSAVAAEAWRRGMEVTMLTRGRRPVPAWSESVVCDCRDRDRLANLLAGRRFDAVVDFLCFRPDQLRDSFSFFSRMTRQYVFISSYAVYEPSQGACLTEEAQKGGGSTWQYGLDKWACERLLMEMAREGVCRYTVIRPSVTYGDTRLPYGVMPRYGWHWTLPARILADKPILTWNRGLNRINMMHVEDFAVGAVGLLGNPMAQDEAFNICGDEPQSYGEVLDRIEDILGRTVRRIDIPVDVYASALGTRADTFLGGRCHDAWTSNAKLKAVVPDFAQKLTLAEGIRRTMEYLLASRDRRRIDWGFDGMTDRLLAACGARVGFVDYTGRATRRDRLAYGAERYRSRRLMMLWHRGRTNLWAVLRRLGRIVHV